MIEPFRDNTGSMARARCADCGGITEFRCAHEGGALKRSGGATTVNPAQANKRLHHLGWSFVGNKYRCPDCEAERREKAKPKPKEEAMTTTEGLRQPTLNQNNEIMEMLRDVYDKKARRYRGAESDKSVVEALGDGILFGWVAQVRETLFGPDGNESADILITEVQEWLKHATLIASLREFNEAKAKIADLVARLAQAQRPRVVAAK